MTRILRWWPVLVAIAVVAGGCTSGPILANPPVELNAPPTAIPTATPRPDPIPIAFPRDDGPHDRLTEWWYYTGHLKTAAGRRFGFEAVIFRAERGSLPVAWASHLALTDELEGQFTYGQRSEVGAQVDRSPRDADGQPAGFDLAVTGSPGIASTPGAAAPSTAAATAAAGAMAPWRLRGANGRDHIDAALPSDAAKGAGSSFALALDLASTRPPALHQATSDGPLGFIDFGPAGSSYYYSRTRETVTGTLTLDGTPTTVTGIAWFDHQWGDFISVGGGGWDWFAINLDDGRDITVSVIRGPLGNEITRYGTMVDPSGFARHLGADDVAVGTKSSWHSPATGRTYPSGWVVNLASESISLDPTVADQELDTRTTSGVAYWEGSQSVTLFSNGIGGHDAGQAYVEITRYGD